MCTTACINPRGVGGGDPNGAWEWDTLASCRKEVVSSRTAEERQRVDESQRVQKTETYAESSARVVLRICMP